jgi:DNA polymerase-3 subunit beta
MKFKSERDLLVEALSAASRVVATRLIGASSGILLSLTGNQLTVTGTDLDITVRTNVDVIGIGTVRWWCPRVSSLTRSDLWRQAP